MTNAFFVVWRECLEAFLVIGILYAWLSAQGLSAQGSGHSLPGRGRLAMAAGIFGGLVLALLLGWAMLAVEDELDGERLELFQTAALLIAALLITQMVLWMQRHGRQIRAEIHAGLSGAMQRNGYLGVAVIAALAVAREGAETVIFLYGIAQAEDMAALLAGAIAGFLAAGVTAWIAATGLARLPIGRLLGISSWLLLVLASALLVAAIDRLIGSGWLPALMDPVWDSSGLVDDGSAAGKLLADFVGYRARPALMTLLVWCAFWLLVACYSLRRDANG